MITSPITTPHFHSRVLALLSSFLSSSQVLARDSANTLANSANTVQFEIPPISPVDTTLTPEESISQVIAVSSSWIDLASPDPLIADISAQVLKLELAYAAFCGIGYVLVPGPVYSEGLETSGGLPRYARAVSDALTAGPYMQVHIWLPIVSIPNDSADQIGDLRPFARQHYLTEDSRESSKKLDLFGSWKVWDAIRGLCKYHSRLSIALSLPRLLPPVSVQARWYSEPVKLLTLSAETFTANVKGYPVLSNAHQALISRYIRLRSQPWFLLCDVGSLPQVPIIVPGAAGDGGLSAPVFDKNNFPMLVGSTNGRQMKDLTPHLSYMRNLQSKQPSQTQIERFGAGYQDYLQAPLQPLTVNLESITYEVFEKDPIKYEWYEKAIARALHDWEEQGKLTSNPNGRVVVAVVGAGRGPLVARALRAAEAVAVEIDIWALEKNPNAFVLLQRHNETMWKNRVNLVKSDMRAWKGPFGHLVQRAAPPITDEGGPIGQAISPEPESSQNHSSSINSSEQSNNRSIGATHYSIDILISELLGSFADNELSPECLDGVQHLLNTTHGISIPASYSAHLTPIAAPKLHADILAQSASNPAAAETPYVVMLHAIDYLSTTTPLPVASSAMSPKVSYAASARQSIPVSPSPQPNILPCWTFQHPNPVLSPHPPTANAHNRRCCTLKFPVSNASTCHGLAGYFETTLYDRVELSTNPATMGPKE